MSPLKSLLYLSSLYGLSLSLSAPSSETFRTFINPGDNIQEILDDYANHKGDKKSVEIILRSGTHYLRQSLRLNPSHSNLTLQGEKGAIIDGGIILPSFEVSSIYPHLWNTTLPDNLMQNPDSLPTQLFINGQRRIRSRSPNAIDSSIYGQYSDEATYHMASVLSPCTAPVWGTCPEVDKLGFVYNSSDVHGTPNPEWNLEDAWILYFQSWTAEWVPFGALYPDNNTLLFSVPAQGTIGQFGYQLDSPSGGRWILENSIDLVDSPGEFFIARSTGQVYYYPYPNETINNVEAVVPGTSTLLNITGTSIYNPVENIHITNVQFQNYGEVSPTARLGFHYANTAAIMVSYAINTLIEQCNITAGMTNGVLIEAGVVNLVIDHTIITDVGGNGISGMLLDGAPNNATNTIISNNTIRQTGFIYMAQPASISLSGINGTIVHNDVSYVPYGAIQVGWQSGTNGPPVPPLPSYAFEIAYNYVHNYGLGILSDFGGIYTSAWAGDDCWVNPDPDTHGCWTPMDIHHNLVTNSSHYMGGYGSNGGYMDEGIDGVMWHHNIMSTTGANSLYFHCGYNNTATNNIFFNSQVQYTSFHSGTIGGCNSGGYTPMDGSLVLFHQNIVLNTNTPSVLDGSGGDDYYWLGHDIWISDYNVWYGINNGKPPLNFPNNTIDLQQWTALTGNDKNSVENDPQLADPYQNNFTVLETSPAWALGWTIIDLSTVGPL